MTATTLAPVTRPDQYEAPLAGPAHREPAFLRYLGGQSVSLLGNMVWYVALSWSAVRLASPGVAGLILVISSAPRLALMLLGGVIADRFDIRRLMLGSDLLRVLVTLAAAGIALARPGIALLAVVALVFGTVDAVFLPSSGAMQPRLLAPEQYAGGAVLANLASRLALSVGAPLGGMLVALGGVPLALLVDAGTFAISVATLATVRPRALEPAPANKPSMPVADLRAGLSFVVRHRVLGPMTLAFLLLNIGFVGPMNIGVAELSEQRGWGSAGIGLLLTGFGLGAALGGLLTVRFRIRANAGAWIAVLGAVQGLCLIGAPFVPSAAVGAAVTGLAGLVSGPVAVVGSVLEQQLTPDEFRGRVSSLQNLIALGLVPVTSAATGFVIAAIGVAGEFALGGLIEVAVLATLLAAEFRTAKLED
jgi:predicted MFS family arabinose efflux permease